MLRPCLDCGVPTVGTRCPPHAHRHHATKYRNGVYSTQRREWTPRVATGLVTCPRCSTPIPYGTPWDLGHQPDGSLHPEHSSCNRRAGAQWYGSL